MGKRELRFHKDRRLGKRKHIRIMAPRYHFTCQKCHKWGWSTIPSRTICKDCSKGKIVTELPNEQWLELMGHVARSRHEEMFFLDLIDRGRPLHQDKELLHFVWSLGLDSEGSRRIWFQGMLQTEWPTYESAKAAVLKERIQIADDIKMGLYHDWPDECPVCSIPLEVQPAFQNYTDFQYRQCTGCNRRWTHWIGHAVKAVETAVSEGAQ